MIPTMQRFNRSQKAQVVRVGPVQLYFSFHELIAFQLDGQDPVACLEDHGRMTTESHLNAIQPDRSKWLSRVEFTQAWLEASKTVFGLELAVL